MSSSSPGSAALNETHRKSSSRAKKYASTKNSSSSVRPLVRGSSLLDPNKASKSPFKISGHAKLLVPADEATCLAELNGGGPKAASHNKGHEELL